MKNEKMFEVLYLTFLMILFFSLSIPYLKLPGIHAEETFVVMTAATIVKEKEPYGVTINILGKNIPIMLHEHVGIISSLMYLPSFFIFGTDVYVMRITRIFFGFICLILLYYFTKSYFNRRIAIIASFLLATLPFYIFLFRHGYLDDGLNPILMLISLICFYKFIKKRKSWLLYAGSFFTGLGLSNKLNFLWYVAALVVCFFFLKNKIKINKKQIIMVVFLFLLGALPIIIYNINLRSWQSPSYNTIQEIRARLVYPRYAGNNLDITGNIGERLSELRYILNNDYNPLVRFTNFLYFPIFVMVFFIYFIMSIKKKKKVIKLSFYLFYLV